MPLRVTRLRRWFAASAILVIAIVAGTYYFARWRVENALKKVPGKLSIEIQQSAQGFTVSKSEGGRTLFKIQASQVIQYKEGGRAELHDVAITLYGKESNRFDQIYGSDFEYNQQTGDVVAHGEVQIDLEANPEGIVRPDQAVPKELKNPIHLRTSGLTFNQKTGNASTDEKVEFRIPQASGTAVGATYTAKDNVLTLHSQVRVEFNGPNPSTLTAASARVTKNPDVITLNQPRLGNSSQTSRAEEARLYLRKDDTVDRVVAQGDVQAASLGAAPSSIHSTSLEILMGQ
jgi:lipopolysaccharide export system protein LptA